MVASQPSRLSANKKALITCVAEPYQALNDVGPAPRSNAVGDCGEAIVNTNVMILKQTLTLWQLPSTRLRGNTVHLAR